MIIFNPVILFNFPVVLAWTSDCCTSFLAQSSLQINWSSSDHKTWPFWRFCIILVIKSPYKVSPCWLFHRNISSFNGWTASRNDRGRKWSVEKAGYCEKWEADGWSGRKGWNAKPPEMGDEWGRDRDGVSKENEEIHSWWVRKWWMGWKRDRWGRLHQWAVWQTNGKSKWKSAYKVKDDDDDCDDDTHT